VSILLNKEIPSLTEPVHRTFTNPNVPDSISAQGVTSLNDLLGFVVQGTGSSPSGSLPEMPPSLHELRLNNTALGPLDSSLFADNGSLSKLEILLLARNSNMGSSIPNGMLNVPLKSLCVPVQPDTITLNNSRFPGRYRIRESCRFLRTSSTLQWRGA
jgi:hypothetical protein